MKESILHYVWQNKLFNTINLQTTDGETVEIIDVGKQNTDAGPDFFNAKVKIDDTLWVGNIEIHSLSSDWNKHNHQLDKAYDNVILHVVGRCDAVVCRTDGELIPQLEITFPSHIETNHEQLLNTQKWIACADKIGSVPFIFIQSWKNALLTERLEQKMNDIEHLLAENNQHWEEAFYITLARNFGFNTNKQAFESLAKSIPVSLLGKHKDNLFQIEALLFGQSGLLGSTPTDQYALQLQQEYQFLKSKYGLKPMDGTLWKLLRLRPDNFPHIRIAQFAALIHSSSKLFSKILESPDTGSIKHLFECHPSDYWHTHYLFGTESKPTLKKIGPQSVEGIIINTVVPFLFCYANCKGKDNLKDKSLKMLEELPAESNAVVTRWQQLGLPSVSAYDSQALLQLKNRYCDKKNCLRCRIGHKVLTLNP